MKKANGDGSIYYEESRKKYCAAITDNNGKRTRKRFDTQAEAKKWLKQSLADVDNNEFVRPSQYTLLQWTLDYIELYKKPNVRASSLRKVLWSASKLKPIGNIQLQSLTPLQIQKFYASLNEYSVSARLSVHILLKETFKCAEANGLIKKNIMDYIPSPKGNTDKIDIFTDEELLKIIEVCKQNVTWECIVTLALNCGLRRGEILGLQVEDVFDDYIFIRNNHTAIEGKSFYGEPKTKSSKRKVPITNDVKDALKRCIGERKSGQIIQSRFKRDFKPNSFNNCWWNILKRAGIERKHFHSLRHTFATKMLAAGVPVANVSSILGHSSPSITYNVYAHSIPELDSKMTKIIENAMRIKPVAPTVAPN